MTLSAEPPRYSSWAAMLSAIREGDEGWRVYALQRAIGLTPADGNFASLTKGKLKVWQSARSLTADGIAGPLTQATILRDAGAKADHDHQLPQGVGYGFAVAEGGGILGATNWSVAGGVDCGPAQWRVKGPPFSLDLLKRAFRPYVALDHACGQLQTREQDYLDRNDHWQEREEALRVAVLAHNWPAGADHIVRNYPGDGRWWRYVPSPDTPATWIQNADGSYPYTHAQWAREYPNRILAFIA